jgi:hypothetical protein
MLRKATIWELEQAYMTEVTCRSGFKYHSVAISSSIQELLLPNKEVVWQQYCSGYQYRLKRDEESTV